MKIDYSYEISEEKIRDYLAIPELERLRWLEDICVLTNMFRQAPDDNRSAVPVTLDSKSARRTV